MKLYKYHSGLRRDLTSLVNDTLYASSSAKLNDPCETLFETQTIKKNLANITSIFPLSDQSQGISQSFDKLCFAIKNNTGIYSLSKNNLDELLWAHYSNSHTGFCIGYDLTKLKSSLSKVIYMDDVTYSNNFPAISIEDINDRVAFIKKAAFIKSKKWLYEDEYRIFFDVSGLVSYDYRAVDAIYFGLNMPKRLTDVPNELREKIVSQECVMQNLQGRGISYFQVELIENSYAFTAKPIEDKFPTDLKYKYSVKKIDHSFIDYGQYGWDINRDIFDKVAEIIRREPYFHELNSIHLQKEKSKIANEPIIFAGYFQDNSSLQQINNYLTIKDIETRYSLINDL